MRNLVLFTAFLLLPINSFAQNNAESLIKVAQVIRVKGEVKVQANIGIDGKVTSAKADSRSPFLKIIAEKMALDLQFKKSDSTTPRVTELVISFSEGIWKTIDESDTELGYGIRIQFSSPSRIDVFYDTLVPKRLLLPRENGLLKNEYCKIHNQRMNIEILPISYGLREWNDRKFGESYERAENKLFPNANFKIYGGCVDNGVKEQETYFCEICRMKRKEWLIKNGK